MRRKKSTWWKHEGAGLSVEASLKAGIMAAKRNKHEEHETRCQHVIWVYDAWDDLAWIPDAEDAEAA
jgi:hypothetical protein